MSVDVGDTYTTGFEIRDAAGVLTNPASYTCSLTLPDGTTVAPPLTNPSTGKLSLDYVTVQAGHHGGKVTTTGTGAGVQPFKFNVDAYPNARILSLKETRDHLNVTSTTNDEELRDYILAASEWVEDKIGQYVVRRTVTQTLWPDSGRLFLKGPVISLTSMVAAYGYAVTTYNVANYYVEPGNSVRPGYGNFGFYYPVTVTYVAGMTVIPAEVRLATEMLVKALWETQRGAAPLPLQGVDDVEQLPGMGLAVWRAEQLLAGQRVRAVV